MRIALLTDIHANREAFEAVLASARTAGTDRLILLGDLVGYGPDPEYAVETSARLVEQGAIVLKGNHDEAATLERFAMTPNAREAMLWTKKRLEADHVRFLADLPVQHRDGDLLYVHASADRPEKWNYIGDRAAAERCLDAADALRVFCGHTHVPVHFHGLRGLPLAPFIPLPGRPLPLSPMRRSVTVVGAVGQPRDGNPAACYALLDTRERTITMERVAYDSEETMRKIKNSGLPLWLGMRLQVGR